MGGAGLLRRRLGSHPVAVAAIAVSVLASLVVVTALQLLSAAITDAGVRSALDVPATERSVVLSASLRPGDLLRGLAEQGQRRAPRDGPAEVGSEAAVEAEVQRSGDVPGGERHGSRRKLST